MDNLQISERLFYICLYSKNGNFTIQPYFNFRLYISPVYYLYLLYVYLFP